MATSMFKQVLNLFRQFESHRLAGHRSVAERLAIGAATGGSSRRDGNAAAHEKSDCMAFIEVQFAPLDTCEAECARLGALLSHDERARAARYLYERDRSRFVVRRGRLREILGQRTGRSPVQLMFTTSPFGKPALIGGGPSFSLSQSSGRMMLVMADVELGCDLERINHAFDWRSLSNRLLGARERAILSALPEPRGRLKFFEWWSRNEAVVKALGEGLTFPLRSLDTPAGGNWGVTVGGRNLTLAAGAWVDGYASSIAAIDDGRPLTLQILTPTNWEILLVPPSGCRRHLTSKGCASRVSRHS